MKLVLSLVSCTFVDTNSCRSRFPCSDPALLPRLSGNTSGPHRFNVTPWPERLVASCGRKKIEAIVSAGGRDAWHLQVRRAAVRNAQRVPAMLVDRPLRFIVMIDQGQQVLGRADLRAGGFLPLYKLPSRAFGKVILCAPVQSAIAARCVTQRSCSLKVRFWFSQRSCPSVRPCRGLVVLCWRPHLMFCLCADPSSPALLDV